MPPPSAGRRRPALGASPRLWYGYPEGARAWHAAGMRRALSAALGGLVSFLSGLASAFVASLGKAESAGEVLFTALRAEVVKIGLIVILLWLVLATYGGVVVPAFLGTFAATAVIFSMAFFVREHK